MKSNHFKCNIIEFEIFSITIESTSCIQPQLSVNAHMLLDKLNLVFG